MHSDLKKTLRELYPHLSEEELEKTIANLDAYLLLAWEIFEDLKEEKKTEGRERPQSPAKPVDSIYRKFDSSPGSF